MRFAILKGADKIPESLLPGAHVVVIGEVQDGLSLRRQGMELRDTLLILGPKVQTAWVARKPIQERTVVEQVVKTRTGALNIDACRTETSEVLTGGGGKLWSHYRDDTTEKAKPKVNDGKGRWPSNVLLVHDEGCKVNGERAVKAPTINRWTDGMKPFGDGAGHPYESTGGHEVKIPNWVCASTCRAKSIQDQGGDPRFFPQFANVDELLAWVVKLLGGP